ncbi:hypothetical protein V6N13_086525 [Hibiscus sabdariffa]
MRRRFDLFKSCENDLANSCPPSDTRQCIMGWISAPHKVECDGVVRSMESIVLPHLPCVRDVIEPTAEIQRFSLWANSLKQF